MTDMLSCIIAEDNQELANVLVHYANDVHLQVKDTVKSGTGLIESVRKHHPDIVLVDINLDRMDGLTACKQILEEGFSPQIIIVTGSNSPNHLLTGIKLGTVDYLQKPVEAKSFEEAVQKAGRRIDEAKLAMQARRETTRFIQITKRYRDFEINEQEIVFVEKTDKRLFEIHLIDGTLHETSTNLDRIKEQCSEAIFVPHKSFLVNYNHIKSIVPNLAVEGNYDITFSQHPTIVPLTRRNYGEYLKLKNRMQPV